MNEYEIMLLTHSEMDEAARTAIVDRAKEAVTTTEGSWGKVHEWGRKKTSYPIQKREDAHYQVIEFDGTGATADEAVRVLRITDGVMRVMVTNRIPEYPEGAREQLERVSDEEFAAGPKERKGGRGGGRGGPRGRDRD